MFRSAPRTTRSAVRLLEGSKTSQKLAPPDTSSLRQQHLLLDSSLNLQGRLFVASTSVPTSRLQTRQFTSTSRNFSRRIRSGDRYQSAAFTNERLVGATDDDLPRKSRKANPFLPFQSSSFVDAFVTTIVGIGMIFVAGTAYLEWYKWSVLVKMEEAFSPGYDPALELATHTPKPRSQLVQDGQTPDSELDIADPEPWTQHLRRKEQDLIDLIVKGEETGHYYVLLGSKGAGKTTMILDAMRSIKAEGVAMCDAHPDLEVFRLRLGKALNYEFNEDTQTSLFQRRDPREAGPALDIERALNKLEKVALNYSKKHHRPPVLIINNVHFFNNDDDGRGMLLQLQQRAEAWAASGIMTMVFSTDDFWPCFVMRRTASRMHVLSVHDLDNKEAIQASMNMRKNSKGGKETLETFETVRKAVSIVGGRLSYLVRVSKARDMLEMANHLITVERGWLLSRIGLIVDCDDDVMDEQKWSSCSWLLLQEFVKRRKDQEDELKQKIEAGEADESALDNLPLPAISFHECRQIMTRTDFMEELDRMNVISIDINHNVRLDSFLILHAAREVVEEEGFEERLQSVRDRIDEIESLHRTRELTFKDVDKGDRIRLSVDKGGARLVED